MAGQYCRATRPGPVPPAAPAAVPPAPTDLQPEPIVPRTGRTHCYRKRRARAVDCSARPRLARPPVPAVDPRDLVMKEARSDPRTMHLLPRLADCPSRLVAAAVVAAAGPVFPTRRIAAVAAAQVFPTRKVAELARVFPIHLPA